MRAGIALAAVGIERMGWMGEIEFRENYQDLATNRMGAGGV